MRSYFKLPLVSLVKPNACCVQVPTNRLSMTSLSAVGLFWAGLFVLALTPSWVQAQEEDELEARPACNRVLPEETILYVRVRSFPELFAKFEENGMGKMMNDERIAPMFTDLYDNLKQEYDENAKENLDDIELEQFKELFAGEMCFAMVAKRRKPMEGILILDVDPESETAEKLLGLARRDAEADGVEVTTEMEDDIEIEILNTNGDRNIHYFRQGNTLYFSTSRDLCAEMIANLKGSPLEQTRPFVENRKYRTIMGHCKVDKDNPPLMTFFADPIEIFKAATRGEPIAAIAVGVLPVIGLDGVLAVGGAVLPGNETFESLNHFHILMASPREGLLKAVSMKAGDYNLSNVIPDDASMAMVTSIDIPKMYGGIESINDTFRGADALSGDLERASEAIGLDIKTEIIDALTGFVSIVAWSDPESKAFNGSSNAYMIEVHDEAKMRETVETLLEKVAEQSEDAIQAKRKDGVDYWFVAAIGNANQSRERRAQRLDDEGLDANERARREAQQEAQQNVVRFPTPAFTFLDNQLVIADSVELLEHLIETHKGKFASMNDAEDYKMVREQAEKLLDGQKPSGIVFSRPVNQLAPVWNALRSDDLRKLIRSGADDQPFLSRLADSMDKNELPELTELESYFNTNGGFMTDDATGIHFLIFDIKADQMPKKK